MALTSKELTEIRQALQSSNTPADKTKTQINAAVEAIESYFETTCKPGINAAIESVAPATFTAGQKNKMVKFWLLSKFRIL